ncbi:TerC family protein [Bacillus sp. B-jedd]|uniref:TerC family protein n=1 Tax=Bacillus sp. B-jedd TaxID=1476857 RepID=UPI00051565BF|nr:TerC family protein [Bacillus sp. B-jedd]CEG26587.1 TerC family integral membrane protein [Bacillus sp. B-jedd]
MEASLVLEYGWVLLVLAGLEGILAADNAVVLAVMVKHLPEKEQKKALFYGLAGAFVFRFSALFMISFLSGVWQVQAAGAFYLLYISLNHILGNRVREKKESRPPVGRASFWITVLKIELADLAFAVDSMLAAVALAITITPAGWFTIGGLDGGQFTVMFLGGMIGIIMMRFAATWFIRLLKKRPSLETAAFLIVGWVGVKLTVFTLAHPEVAILPAHFPESFAWKITFWTVLIGIATVGFILSKRKVLAQSRS